MSAGRRGHPVGRDGRVRLGMPVIRAVAAWLAVAVAVRVVVLPPERCGSPDPAAWQRSAQLAVTWFAANQRPDGRWLYRYDRATGQVSDDYNLVRHAGVTLALGQAVGHGMADAAAPLQAGLAYAVDHLVAPAPIDPARDNAAGEEAAFGQPGAPLDVGATALLVAALVEARLAESLMVQPGRGRPSTIDDETLGALGRFLVGQLGADGSVASFRLADGAVEVAPSRFYTGEVTWALVRLHRLFPDGAWREPAERALAYLVNQRDDVEDWFPPIADHWAAYALAEAAPLGLLDGPVAPGLAPFAQAQARRFGPQVRAEAQRTSSWFTILTRGHAPVGAAIATVGEGLAGLHRAVRAHPQVAAALPEPLVVARLACVAEILTRRQTTSAGAGADAALGATPERVAGAWFASDVTQMDDQQHALSALLGALDASAAVGRAAGAGRG